MGVIVIVAYRAKPGKQSLLLELTKAHLDILRGQGLATGRSSHAMQATDGTVIEVFEWKSQEAIAAAHTNPVIQKMWARYAEACDYVPLASVKECSEQFAGFAPIDLRLTSSKSMTQERGKMIKSLALGTILGGLVAFLWSSISWEVLGWHERTMVSFQNEDEVAAVIESHAVKDGMYILPSAPPSAGMTSEQKKEMQAALVAKMQKGPIVVAAVRRSGFEAFSRALIIQLLCLMAGAFLLTWLLLQPSGLSYARRVLFLAVVGLAASVIVDLPNWNWWGFSGPYTAVNLADSTVTWLLAGLVIAKVVKPRAA